MGHAARLMSGQELSQNPPGLTVLFPLSKRLLGPLVIDSSKVGARLEPEALPTPQFLWDELALALHLPEQLQLWDR
jgi:hypothetical protein